MKLQEEEEINVLNETLVTVNMDRTRGLGIRH